MSFSSVRAEDRGFTRIDNRRSFSQTQHGSCIQDLRLKIQWWQAFSSLSFRASQARGCERKSSGEMLQNIPAEPELLSKAGRARSGKSARKYRRAALRAFLSGPRRSFGCRLCREILDVYRSLCKTEWRSPSSKRSSILPATDVRGSRKPARLRGTILSENKRNEVLKPPKPPRQG